MMKTGRNHKLFNRLTRHVGEFWSRASGLPSSCIVALSGGVDSTLLLEVVSELAKIHTFKVRAVHVDHGTQNKQAKIESHLQAQCDRLNVELIIVRTQLDSLASNFEATARSQRLRLLEQSCSKDDVIVFGHHIDDSYEWSLMQSLRSSRINPTLGIPFINGRRVKPFMCLTRKQISSIHKKLGLWAFHDESNSDERFSRNHLRRVINKEFAPRYPNYLQHYVACSNDLARKLGLSVFKQGQYETCRADGVRTLMCADPRDHLETLVELHRELSNIARSSVRREVAKLCKAALAGRKGPHQLPGGVKAWPIAGAIIMANEQGRVDLINKWNVGSHIPELSQFSPNQSAVFIVIWQAPAWIAKNAIKSHPLVSIPANAVLLPWSRMVKIGRGKKLSLRWKALNI